MVAPIYTHRLLAQRVKLIARTGSWCRVEFPDGSCGTVLAERMVSAEAVRLDQASSSSPKPEPK